MKLQSLIIIFIIIVLPIILILSLYVSNSLKTVEYQTLYDNGLVNAAHDALYAFEMNTSNDELSENPEVKRDILKASIKMYEKSLSSTCNIPSYNTDEIEEYIPAIVFGMHDGFYMYAPSYNSTTGKYEHSLKNYVYYSETVKNNSGNEFTITYSLDNYITIAGDFGTGYEIRKGYLRLIDPTSDKQSLGEEYYKYPARDTIEIATETIDGETNTEAREYYSNSFKFTHEFLQRTGLKDVVIDGVNPFDIKEGNDPEDENSAFNMHKRKIIREKIENVLNSTITAYSKRMWGKNYKMPKLSESEWDKVYSNISMISFFQGKEIGFTKYNGYTVVNSTNSKEYVNPSLMYFISGEKYHDIRCSVCESSVTSTPPEELTGYRIGSFSPRKIETEEVVDNGDGTTSTITKTSNEYDHEELACYECINNASSTSISVYDYINPENGSASTAIKNAYWTSLGRERNDASEITQVDAKIYVSFDLNEGTSSFDINAYNAIYEHGKYITFPDKDYPTNLKSQITRTGYEFDGWSTTKNGTPLASVDNVKAYTDITFYAVWKPTTVNIKFHWNYAGANPAYENREIEYGKLIFAYQPTAPYRLEWTLVGWSTTTSDANMLTNEQIGSITATEDDEYFAIWDKRRYDITFDFNDGSGRQEVERVEHGTLINSIIEKPERANHIFKGWGINPTGEEIIDEGLTATSDGTYYAIWIPIYSITFDYDGGKDDDGRSSIIRDYAKDAEIIFPSISKYGHTLRGWQKNGAGDIVNTAVATETTTYKANWEINKYTIEFYFNRDDRGMISKQEDVAHGSNISFPADPSIRGLTFIGWSKDPESTTGIRSAQALGNVMGETIKYYAIWQVNTYDITFNYNGGKDSAGRTAYTDADKEYGTKVVFPTITREGYTFEGWKKDGVDGFVNTANEIVEDNVTYTASWKAKEYTITYKRNHSNSDNTTLNLEPKVALHNRVVELPTPPTRTGYDFLGWSTSRTGEPSHTLKTTQNITVYAIWQIRTYDITFDFNDGTGRKEVKTDIEHFTVINSIKPANPTRAGYIFKGWSESSDNNVSSVITFNNTTPIAERDITYYAVWQVKTYTIEYMQNHSSSDNTKLNLTPNSIKFGETKSLATASRTGYVFLGWSTTRSGSAVKSLSVTTDNYTNDKIILYARWQQKTYTIEYIRNHNTSDNTKLSLSPNSIKFGEEKTLPTPSNRTGYRFLGWSTTRTGTAFSKLNVTTDNYTNDTIILYARWEINEYTITYKRNYSGVSEPYATEKATYGLYTLKSGPTRSHYTFNGWSTGNDNTPEYSAGESITLTQNMTFYATWIFNALEQTPGDQTVTLSIDDNAKEDSNCDYYPYEEKFLWWSETKYYSCVCENITISIDPNLATNCAGYQVEFYFQSKEQHSEYLEYGWSYYPYSDTVTLNSSNSYTAKTKEIHWCTAGGFGKAYTGTMTIYGIDYNGALKNLGSKTFDVAAATSISAWGEPDLGFNSSVVLGAGWSPNKTKSFSY